MDGKSLVPTSQDGAACCAVLPEESSCPVDGETEDADIQNLQMLGDNEEAEQNAVDMLEGENQAALERLAVGHKSLLLQCLHALCLNVRWGAAILMSAQS